MNDDLSVNYNGLIKHINWLLDNGSNGICLLGTTGEANSFSVDERLKVIDEVISAGIDPKVLLVGTGTCALPDTIKLTKYAIAKGAGGVLMLPPFYYKDLSDQGVLDYFKLVIEGVDDPQLKIYLYHFPKMTGVPFTLELVQKLVKAFPGVIVGLKDSSGNWQGMKAVCELLPGFQLFTGTEKYLLDTLRVGGAGCISATFNASIKQGADVYANWQNDNADNLQAKLSETRNKFEVTSFISGLKFLYAKWTGDKGWLNMRPPNSLPNDDAQESLLANLTKEDFFE
ncbi:MAG: dihydrodipicolinate synthase family protein [Bacteroidetes bacterium]|nr:MAG: dihydrodipicolinate synthase family protein [Bacteroidota bacterium]